jgi:hypothetical protein
LSVLFFAGCVSVPRGTPLEFSEEQHAALRAFPDQPFWMEQIVVFTLRDRNFAGFGFTRIEPQEEKFAATCLSAQGMTIFELAGQNDRLEICRTLPGAGEPEVVGKMFADGIRNVYFGNVPAPDARFFSQGGLVAKSVLEDGDWVRHDYQIDGRLDAKRRFTHHGKIVWDIQYADYDDTGPTRIVLHDNSQQMPYTLNLRVTSWRVAGEEK